VLCENTLLKWLKRLLCPQHCIGLQHANI